MQRTYSIFLCQECAAKGTLSETLCDSTNAELVNLLRAGQAPSYAQVSETFITEYELQDTVVKLQSVLDQIKGRMDKLKRRIELQRALVAPIRNLPAELLALIFSYCSSKGTFSMAGKYNEPSFMSVCIRWRNVALNSAVIWTGINLTLSSICNSEALSRYLARSGTALLTVGINILFPRPDDYHFAARNLLSPIMSVSRRWQRLTLSFQGTSVDHGPSWHIRDHFSVVLDQLSMLATLEFALCEPNEPLAREFLLLILQKSPGLRALLSPPFKSADDNFIHSFPTNNHLHRLEVDHSTDQDCMIKILNRCPRLLSLSYCVDESIFLSHTQTLVQQSSSHPTLEELNIFLKNSGRDDRLSRLIDSLTFPSLKSLSVKSVGSSEPFSVNMWPRDEFSDFFHRSRCELTSLTLGPMLGVMFNDSDVVSLLQSTPTLTEPNLHDSTGSLSGRVITPELCQCLHIPPLVPVTFTQFTGPLVPNLEKLVLGVNLLLAAFDEDVLIRMILSRCQLMDMSGPEGRNPLQRLELRFISDDDGDYLFDHIKSSVLAIKSMSIIRWPGST